MTDAAIWDAFCARLAAFATSKSVPVLYPGVGGEPPNTGLWLEARYFPNKTRNYGVADSGPFTMIGFCQVSVCGRPGYGLAPSLALVTATIAHFDKGTVLGPAKVDQPAYVSTILEEADRVIHPITIPYVAHGSH